MNAKEVEANRDCEKTIQNENNFPNFAAPPSYDEVIGTQQSLINGRQQEGGYVRQQPDHCTKPKVIFMAVSRIELRAKNFLEITSTFSTEVFTIRPLVGLYPENLICPFCQDRITTRVEYVVTAKTHFSAMICCAL